MIKPKEKLTKGQRELLDIYYNHKDKCDHIWIEGTIDYSSNPDGKQKLLQLDSQIREYTTNDKVALVLHINSTGGDGNDSIFLYNYFSNFPKPKIGVVESSCMSAATYIFLSCELRIFKPLSLFMMHQTSITYNEDSRRTFKETRRSIYSLQNEYNDDVNFYHDRTKMSIQEVKKYIRMELVMTGSECVKFGIAHHIFDLKLVKPHVISKNSKVIKVVATTFVNALPTLIYTDNSSIKSVDIFLEHSPYYDGYLEEPFKIANLIMELSFPVNFYISGQISFGQFIYTLYGTSRKLIAPYTSLIFHPVYILKYGLHYGLVEDYDKNNKTIRKMMYDILQDKTKLPSELINEMFVKEFSFKPQEALKFGIVDKLVTINQGKVSPYKSTKQISLLPHTPKSLKSYTPTTKPTSPITKPKKLTKKRKISRPTDPEN